MALTGREMRPCWPQKVAVCNKDMMEDDLVYFSDLSDPLIRIEKRDYEQELDIRVMDLSWDLELGE